jgi:aminopeptidase-like protein
MDFEQLGVEMHRLICELYPVCRSITGDGLRMTLRRLQQEIPLAIHEVPTGTPVFDWTIPREWNIRDAYIKNEQGERVVDFHHSNLHVLNYSVPIHRRMSLAELKVHLFSLPDQPTLIPYRTSYYHENWGFCIDHETLLSLKEGEYEVCIDTELAPGHLTYGEAYLPGKTTDEVLISCHSCHPSLCNDNLSGVVLATFLARHLQNQTRWHSFRFLFIPGTIGSIAWLALHEAEASRIRHGLVAACVGDSGKLHYKRSRRGNATIDRAVLHVLVQSGDPHEVLDFSPYGYDERQYCSPGFDLPVGCLSRTPYGRFAEYHTSADNPDFVHAATLADSLAKYLAVIRVLECNRTYVNTNPKCEPQLGRRGLYSIFGGKSDTKANEMAMLWVLNMSDGAHTLLDIAEKADLPFDVLKDVAQTLCSHGLLKEVNVYS